MYYLIASTVIGTSCSIQNDEAIHWHKRLRHLGEKVLKGLQSKNVIKLGSDSKLKMCEQCVLGKSKKLPYPTWVHISKNPLDYIHSDLWGPSQIESIGGGKYFLTIMDDFSRKVWVSILKEKSQAFDSFKKWCLEREVEKGSTVKCLRMDNGMEFLSGEFIDFCKLKGIKRHRTVPHNP